MVDSAILLPSDGALASARVIEYSAAPEELLVCLPYLIALVPSKDSHFPSLQVHSLLSLSLVQTIALSSVDTKSKMVSLLTATSPCKSPIAFLTSSISVQVQSAKQSSVSSISTLTMPSWSVQIDELVYNGSYEEALSLLESVEDILLPDKAERRYRLRSLQGLALFLKGRFDAAIDLFIDLDVNPAKVVCLYPEKISGKLYKDEYHREQIFGGRSEDRIKEIEEKESTKQSVAQEDNPSSLGAKKWTGISPYRKSLVKDDDTASIHSAASHKTQTSQPSLDSVQQSKQEEQAFKQSLEVLLRYLADCRQKVNKALASLRPSARPTPSKASPPASATDLFDLPDGSFSELKPIQMEQVAQIVDTALFKCYLAIRPTLLGPLCRLENWCEVEEVETLLKEAKVSSLVFLYLLLEWLTISAQKYRELLDLYHGKNNHSKALELLQM